MTTWLKQSILVLSLLFLALFSVQPATAYPCFYEKNAPTRLGGGQNLLAGKVDAATGAFINNYRCMMVDGLIPLDGAIFYSTQDNSTGPCGKGTSTPYDWYITTSTAWPGSPYVLIAPGNQHFVFDTNSAGIYKDTRDPKLLGATLSFTGQPTGVWCTLSWKDGQKFQFDLSGGLIKISDRYANYVTITRNAANGFPAWVYLNGNTNRWIKYIQDVSNQHVVKIQAQWSSGGNVRQWTIAYDRADNLGKMTTLTGPLTSSYTFTWTSYIRSDGVSLPLLQTVRDGRNMTPLSVHYDASGRVSSLDSTLGGAHTFSWTAGIGANGTVTGVDPSGRSVSIAYAWNPYGHGYNGTSVTDNTQHETMTIARNAVPTYLPTSVTDYRNRVRTYAWDTVSGDLTGFSTPTATGGSASYTVAYNPTYHIRNRITDPTGRVYQWNVDASGNVTSYTDPAGNVTGFTFNSQGKVITRTDPLGHTTTWGRDVNGFPVSIRDAAGHTSSVTRNDIGLMTAATDPLNNTVNYAYDLLDRLSTVTHWLNIQTPLNTNYTYDATGNMLTATDATGHVWSWTYDCIGNVLTETDPNSHTRLWSWTATNHVQAYTDFAGNRWEAGYLTDGRLSGVNFRRSNGTIESSTTYSFDPTTHLVSSVSDTMNGTISMQRDLLDQLTSFTGPNGGVTYQYDSLGRRTQMQVAGQNPVTYGYNAQGNISWVSQSGSTIGFSYDGLGRLTGQTFPNGVVTAKEYNLCDQCDEVCSVKNGVMFDVTVYNRDTAHKLTSINNNGITQTLGYDTLNRVTSLVDTTRNYSWVYNNNGTKASQTLNGLTTGFTYDPASNLTAVGGSAVTRDLNGYPSAYAGRTYSWNIRGQLQGYTMPGSTLSFTYDPYGRRVSTTVNGTRTNDILDFTHPVRQVTNGVGVDVLNGPTFGGPIKYGNNYLSTDGRGSTTKLTDTLGNVVGTNSYDPFGFASGAGTQIPSKYQGSNNYNPSLVTTGGSDYSPDWGLPLGGTGIKPRGPTAPSNPIAMPQLTNVSYFADDPAPNSDPQTVGAKDEEEHRKADSSGLCGTGAEECFGPPRAGTGELPEPAKSPGSGGSQPVQTIVPGMRIGLGIFQQNRVYCKPGSINMAQLAQNTGAQLDPFYKYGMQNSSPQARLPCAIVNAETIDFNLDGFNIAKAQAAPPDFEDGNYTNAEYQMCMTPEIFPKVNWWECGRVVTLLPAPANPYSNANPDAQQNIDNTLLGGGNPAIGH